MTETAKKQDEPMPPSRHAKGDFVQDRALSTRAGTKFGWRKVSVLERAYRSGKLVDKERCVGSTPHATRAATEVEIGRAFARLQAGERFTEGWLVANSAGWAASDLNRVRVVGTPGSFVDFQIDVKNFMRALEKILGTRDWMILRRVCGENYPIAETITDISPGYRYSTLARFREALDALVDAIPKAETQGK